MALSHFCVTAQKRYRAVTTHTRFDFYKLYATAYKKAAGPLNPVAANHPNTDMDIYAFFTPFSREKGVNERVSASAVTEANLCRYHER